MLQRVTFHQQIIARDRHDKGERAMPLYVPATQWNQAKILQ